VASSATPSIVSLVPAVDTSLHERNSAEARFPSRRNPMLVCYERFEHGPARMASPGSDCCRSARPPTPLDLSGACTSAPSCFPPRARQGAAARSRRERAYKLPAGSQCPVPALPMSQDEGYQFRAVAHLSGIQPNARARGGERVPVSSTAVTDRLVELGISLGDVAGWLGVRRETVSGRRREEERFHRLATGEGCWPNQLSQGAPGWMITRRNSGATHRSPAQRMVVMWLG
jgi:hypothetical protein